VQVDRGEAAAGEFGDDCDQEVIVAGDNDPVVVLPAPFGPRMPRISPVGSALGGSRQVISRSVT
jgi:hypothetical protein